MPFIMITSMSDILTLNHFFIGTSILYLFMLFLLFVSLIFKKQNKRGVRLVALINCLLFLFSIIIICLN